MKKGFNKRIYLVMDDLNVISGVNNENIPIAPELYYHIAVLIRGFITSYQILSFNHLYLFLENIHET